MDYREHKIMEQKDKELLLKDLCARLPYGVKANSRDGKKIITVTPIGIANFMSGAIDIIKPYLRPMSSITKEEYNELEELIRAKDLDLNLNEITAGVTVDWLNNKMFDFRGLIPKSLAIEVIEENNPYKD